MEADIQRRLAVLLRAAAAQTIPERDFWVQFKGLVDPFSDLIAGLAYESATHYWGNFHERNLFFIRVRPDRYQVLQGKNELNLIADALDNNWSVSDLKQKLKDI